MGKRIILLSDGTGNSAAKVWRTNVWRVFESLDLSGPEQVAFYDDGVGTSSFKPLAILGGALGVGLKRNVLDLYKFVCRNYRSKEDYERTGVANATDDEIFAFGFSRGAFTIRVVTGLIARQGLVTFETEAELDRKAKAAYRAYRMRFRSRSRIEAPFRLLRNLFVTGTHDAGQRPVRAIRFVGVWDTVAAYGLPIDEMTRGIDQWIWPLELPDHRLHEKVKRACHALSLDDERTTFHPVLWDESQKPPEPPSGTPVGLTSNEIISQVWFAGVHSNVGGGYPDDSLANVSLNWIMAEAKVCGLKFKVAPNADPDSLVHAKAAQDKDGRLYDSRAGVGGYYRYGPRKLADLCDTFVSKNPDDRVKIALPKIHQSVFGRIKDGAHLYAPIGLPEKYAVVDDGRAIVVHDQRLAEGAAQAAARHQEQEQVWNIVWQRRAIYFLTVFASLYLALYPLFTVTYPSEEMATRLRLLSDTIRLIGIFLPSGADRWLNAYAGDPAMFMVAVVMVAFLIWFGSRLGGEITDTMRKIWNRHLGITAAGADGQGNGTGFSLSKLGWGVVVAVLAYLALYPVFDRVQALHWLTLPAGADALVKEYAVQPVRFVIITFLIIYLLPRNLIEKLRTLPAYQWSLRRLKYVVAPALFAIAMVYLAAALASHALFTIRDNFGSFCEETTVNGRALDPDRNGLNVCRNENLAQCDRSGTNRTAATPPMTCTPACEEAIRLLDFTTTPAPATPVTMLSHDVSNAQLRPNALCLPTGIMLERGGSYRIAIERDPPDTAWTFWGAPSHTGGAVLKELPTWKRVALWILTPFRRTLDRSWDSVIMRYGKTGTEESFIDPDQEPDKKERLSEILKPGRDGELFVYLNKPVVGIPGMETLLDRWLTTTARMKLTVKRTN